MMRRKSCETSAKMMGRKSCETTAGHRRGAKKELRSDRTWDDFAVLPPLMYTKHAQERRMERGETAIPRFVAGTHKTLVATVVYPRQWQARWNRIRDEKRQDPLDEQQRRDYRGWSRHREKGKSLRKRNRRVLQRHVWIEKSGTGDLHSFALALTRTENRLHLNKECRGQQCQTVASKTACETRTIDSISLLLSILRLKEAGSLRACPILCLRWRVWGEPAER
jgi:hypothetical protein